MSSVKTIRRLRELLNKIYLTYSMTLKLPDVILSEIEKEINESEPRIVETAVLGNDIVIRPEPEANRDVHTEHCCKIHGCVFSGKRKYGYSDEEDGVYCSVVSGKKSQSARCEICYEEEGEAGELE